MSEPVSGAVYWPVSGAVFDAVHVTIDWAASGVAYWGVSDEVTREFLDDIGETR